MRVPSMPRGQDAPGLLYLHFHRRYLTINTMKKLRLAGVVLLLAAVLSSCGIKKTEEQQPASPKTERITVGFSQVGSESDWRMASTASIQDAFADSPYTLLFNDGQQKQENQIKAIREFIDQDVDYIILDPCVETGWDSALMEAKEAGIPVIVIDREVSVEDESLYTAWIGSDFYLEGQRAMKWLESYLQKENYEEPLNLVGIQGTIGATAQIGRSRALEEAAAAHDNWTLLEEQPGDYTEAKGKEVMEEYLRKYKDEIQVVYCENDNEAYGAIDAIREAGKKVGMKIKDGEILVLSFDATHGGLQLTMEGKIAVNTECSPLYGKRLVRMIDEMEQGELPEHHTYIEEGQFSSYSGIRAIWVVDNSYLVTRVTEELLEEREY